MISIGCRKHPRYTAVKAPRCCCLACRMLWALRKQEHSVSFFCGELVVAPEKEKKG